MIFGMVYSYYNPERSGKRIRPWSSDGGMKKYWKKTVFLLFVVGLLALTVAVANEMLTLEALKRNSGKLHQLVQRHYLFAVLVFAAAFFSTAFIVPGTLVLTLGAGYFFGAVQGTVYASLFLTASSTVAFLASRYLIGSWVQRRFVGQLRSFNAEIERHGMNYLFVLRVVPVMPAFVINYLSGLTRISTGRYVIISFLGILPGAVVYSLAGRQLAFIRSTGDIASGGVLIGLLLLAVFALLPVMYRRAHRLFRRR